uniref:Uncharacterized protein LOC113791467 n=1 Tax=Dermatophagoides pteronyssinus TaxID=6956 RepID=A0A6P6XYK9_DERPT|nr:uncharacterized protein LOC113791467 [Dermatophagoides pteronyssinus]
MEMQNKQHFDVVTVWEMKKIPGEGGYQATNTWNNCPIYFTHISDFWTDEQRQFVARHRWPTDGSDYAIVIGIPQQFQQYIYKSIPMNEVNYIHSIDHRTIIINTLKFECAIEISDSYKMASIFYTLYGKIPCFYWDLIITNPNINSFCLLNRNYSRLNNEPEPEQDDDDDDNNNSTIRLPPPSIPTIDGQSTSASTTYSMPPPTTEMNDLIEQTEIMIIDDGQNDGQFWDEEELDEIVFGDDF